MTRNAVILMFLVLMLGGAAHAAAQEAEESAVDEEAATGDAGEAVVDPASDPPTIALQGESQLHTSVSAWSRSELYFTERPRLRSIGNGRYAMAGSQKVFPFYQTLGVRADQLGHKGLSLHFNGWVGLDLAEVYFDQRVIAELTTLYVQFRDYGVDAKFGRQMVFSGVMRALYIDGISVEYQFPFHLGIQLVGGLMVIPDLGPDWYAMTPEEANSLAVDFDDFGADFSQWKRDFGELAIGGRVFYQMDQVVNLGVSILHTSHLDQTESELVGFDVDFRPLDFLAISGDGAFDLFFEDWREFNAAVDWVPDDIISVGVDYRHTDPSLYLSHLSIFSVFSDEEYDSVGANVAVAPMRQLTLYGEYHQNFYGFLARETVDADYDVAREYGFDTRLGARYKPQPGWVTIFDYRVFSETDRWLQQLRGGLVLPIFVEGLRAHTNLYLDFYGGDTAVGDGSQRVGFLGDLGLNYRRGAIETGGSIMAGLTPYAQHVVSGMLKFGYNFDWRSYKRY